ncbi:Glutaredoxin, partial [Thalictrum thalictroides]
TTPPLPVVHSTSSLHEAEIINTWELMKELEDGIYNPVVVKKNLKPLVHHHQQFQDIGIKPVNSFKKQNKFGGKENKPKQNGRRRLDFSPPPLNSRVDQKTDTFIRFNSRLAESSKQSLRPLFDPELIAFFEEEPYEEGEQIKNMISFKPESCKALNSETILDMC